MSRTAMSAEAKASMQANLELEFNARKEKLVAMSEAQCASLRSRIERRVNRVPSNKRNTKLIEILEPAAASQKPAAIRKAREAKEAKDTKESAPAPARRTRTAAPAVAAPKPAPAKPLSKVVAKAAPKSTRGVKRNSDDISADDKENNGDLNIPKKRAKAAPAPRARTTRAASKKVDPAPQVLSPKTNNARPAPQTRTRRPR